MDSFFDSLGKLLGTFKDPTQVVLLLICIGEAVFIYKIARFVMDRYDKEIESRGVLANALNGLKDVIREKMK